MPTPNQAWRRGRLGLYLGLLALLTLLAGIAVWSVGRTGAWLTDQGDWQTLPGDWNYRIGTIDYKVSINSQTLVELDPETRESKFYKLVVPQKGGVRMFDPTVDSALRTAEFNEGVTLARLVVENHSDGPIEVTAALSVLNDDGGRLRVIPLPRELNSNIATLDLRAFSLSNVGFTENSSASETQSLSDFADQYYLKYPQILGEGDASPREYSFGVLPGVITGSDGEKIYASADCYLLIWSEYQNGDYNSAVTGKSEPPRTGQLQATLSVGQLE